MLHISTQSQNHSKRSYLNNESDAILEVCHAFERHIEYPHRITNTSVIYPDQKKTTTGAIR